MEQRADVGELIHSLMDSLRSQPVPTNPDTARARAWVAATRAIEGIAYRSAHELVQPPCAVLLCAIVRACRKLGAVECVAYAAALAGALRLNLGPVYDDEPDCDCAA